MKNRLSLLLTGLTVLFCSAKAQFTGNYTITDGTNPPGFHQLGVSGTPWVPVTYGNWSGYSLYGGGMDTTNAASGTIVLSGVAIGNQSSATATLKVQAVGNINVSFDLTPTGVYGSGISPDAVTFGYTVDNWVTSTVVFSETAAVSNAAYSPIHVSFYVPGGSVFGMGFTASHGSGTGIEGMSATISNFTVAAAVPEPSTYAMLAGLGALGVAVLRRRRMATIGGRR